MEKRPALGKGLSALIPEVPASPAATSSHEVDIDLIAPNELQPRHSLDDTRLDELAQSIRANGVIQPIVVRRTGGRYQIIAGERRWRAAQRAGLLRVPVVVREIDEGGDAKILEMALIENIQREDLNPIDEALAYARLASEFTMTQDAIAAAVGKDRTSVTNHLRLLKLPHEVRAEVAAGRLSMGHARALLAVADDAQQRQAARDVIAQSLSVRETEMLVKRLGETSTRTEAAAKPVDVHVKAAEDRLKLALGTRVRIRKKGKGGRIEIEFVSEDELQRLYERLVTP